MHWYLTLRQKQTFGNEIIILSKLAKLYYCLYIISVLKIEQ